MHLSFIDTGMLFRDEQMLLSQQFLYYTHVVFQPVTESGVTSTAKNNMTQGRAFLTNHRIILLSAEESQGRVIIDSSFLKSKILQDQILDTLGVFAHKRLLR